MRFGERETFDELKLGDIEITWRLEQGEGPASLSAVASEAVGAPAGMRA
jgi:hypothetical protein